MQPVLQFIGEVHSELKRKEDCPLQEHENAPAATIELYPEFVEGIKDIKTGDTVVVLTWLHEADRSVIKCFPRNNYDAPVIGVFSTRSPDRPNPIGMHTAKVLAVSGNTLELENLEVLDQTPVVDIKPKL